MNTATLNQDPLFSLHQAYLRQYPDEAARRIEAMPMDEAIEVLQGQPEATLTQILEKLTPGNVEGIITRLPRSVAGKLLTLLSVGTCTTLLARLDEEDREQLLAATDRATAKELRALLDYPENSAGRQMNPRVAVFNQTMKVAAAIAQLRASGLESGKHLYLVNDKLQLASEVDVQKLLFADPNDSLDKLADPISHYVQDIDPRDEVMDKLEESRTDALPVVDINYHVVGIIEGSTLIDALRENIVLDMQTMVGASREERALSTSLFAVRKRLPWLQINLITAFLAASVVGMFEATIAQFTALAVLLPIAAGQSGNTGAQALAVTMRGLTLREISLRDWLRILMKELFAGLLNGIGIAAVCSLGVYLWSDSYGLALVMGLSMVISMTIAGMAGALVPILLKRFGLDPAQSSSIVLTTVTDIAGFMSFLGIATLLAGML